MTDATTTFSEQRDLLTAVAYRVLGSVADAEDVVQDAWLRWANVPSAEVVDPRAYLVRVTTRLAIDRLRRVKARRESYVGPWLPEPLLTGGDVADDVELAESVSMALLVVLERLSPLERVVFVLHEAFDVPYAEIADTLERSEPAVRQLASRARTHVQERRPRFDASPPAARQLAERFMTACTTGDLQSLMQVLAPDVTLVADGGGLAPAPRRPLEGALTVARFLVGITAKPLADPGFHPVHLNGAPGYVVTTAGVSIAAIVLAVTESGISTVYIVSNPEKLAGVRDVASG